MYGLLHVWVGVWVGVCQLTYPRKPRGEKFTSMASQVLNIHHPFFAGGTARAGIQYPKHATIEVQALFQILSHAARKRPGQKRIVGTLMGSRSEDGSEIDIRHAYVIPVTEKDNEVSVDIDYHAEMFALLRKAHRDMQIVGWYTTTPEINNLSALIHEFYSQEHGTLPHPPVHLTVDPDVAEIKFNAYVGLPMWTSPENGVDGNCIFAPIAHSVRVSEFDQPFIAAASQPGGADVLGLSQSVDDAVADVLKQIDVVSARVKAARSSPSSDSDALARHLYEIVANAPVLEPPVVQQQRQQADPRSTMYNAYMRDLVTVVSLANSIKWQVQLTSEVSSKLV